MSDYSVTIGQSVGMILYQQVVVVVCKCWMVFRMDLLSLIFESRLARFQKSQSLFYKNTNVYEKHCSPLQVSGSTDQLLSQVITSVKIL